MAAPANRHGDLARDSLLIMDPGFMIHNATCSAWMSDKRARMGAR